MKPAVSPSCMPIERKLGERVWGRRALPEAVLADPSLVEDRTNGDSAIRLDRRRGHLKSNYQVTHHADTAEGSASAVGTARGGDYCTTI